MKKNEIKKNTNVIGIIYNGFHQKANTRQLAKCFATYLSADVRHGSRNQSKRGYGIFIGIYNGDIGKRSNADVANECKAVPSNSYDTLYDSLCGDRSVQAFRRFMAFLEFDSVVYNGPARNITIAFYFNTVYANYHIPIARLLRLTQADALGVRHQILKRAIA